MPYAYMDHKTKFDKINRVHKKGNNSHSQIAQQLPSQLSSRLSDFVPCDHKTKSTKINRVHKKGNNSHFLFSHVQVRVRDEAPGWIRARSEGLSDITKYRDSNNSKNSSAQNTSCRFSPINFEHDEPQPRQRERKRKSDQHKYQTQQEKHRQKAIRSNKTSSSSSFLPFLDLFVYLFPLF